MAKHLTFLMFLGCECFIFALLVTCVKGNTCWDKTWYNSFSPRDHGGSDVEIPTSAVLNAVCPFGRQVVAARCKDEKEEIFTGFRNDSVNQYIVTCTVATGLLCHPYNDSVGASCADFAIQYGCNCSTTSSTLPLSSTTYLTSSTHSADIKSENNTFVEEKKSSGAEYPEATLQIGTWSVKWWIFLLVVSGCQFVLTIVIFSVCLCKMSVTQRTRQTRVQALNY